MRHVFLAVVIFSLNALTDPLVAQDFRDGYVITNNEDTLRGQLEYRSKTKNYYSCVFKKNGQTKNYSPDEIRAYGFSNDMFYTSQVVDSAFAEVLVLGQISLYKLETIYLLEKNSEQYVLESKEIEVTVNGKDYYKRDKRWKGILNALINDCLKNSYGVVERIELNEKSITTVITNYNQCQVEDNHVVFKEEKEWSVFEIGISGGLIYSKLDARIRDQIPDIPKAYKSVDPVIGIDMIFHFPRISERFGLQTSLQFARIRYADRLTVEEANRFIHYDSYVKLNTLSMPLGLIYKMPEKSISWFANGGMIVDVQLGSESRMEKETIRDNKVYNEADRAAFLVEDIQLGFWVGTGLSKRFGMLKARLWGRYTRMGNMTNSVWIDINQNRFSLGITLSK